MKSVTVDILDPKAEAILKDLEGQSFIRITNQKEGSLRSLIDEIRLKAENIELTEGEIQKEVKAVRKLRYDQKGH